MYNTSTYRHIPHSSNFFKEDLSLYRLMVKFIKGNYHFHFNDSYVLGIFIFIRIQTSVDYDHSPLTTNNYIFFLCSFPSDSALRSIGSGLLMIKFDASHSLSFVHICII